MVNEQLPQHKDPAALQERINSLEAQLLETHERLHSFLSLSREMVCCIKFDTAIPTQLPACEQAAMMLAGRLSDCNDRFARGYGFECRSDLIGQRFMRLVGTDEETILQRAARLVRSGYRVTEVENEVRRVDGSVRQIINSSHGEVRDGKLMRVWVTGRDVTAQRLMEAAATEGPELYRVAKRLDSAFWVLNWTDFETLYVDPGVEDRLGIKKAVVESDPLAWLSVVHTADRQRVRDSFLTHAASGQFDETFRITLPGGRIRWFRNQAIPLPADEQGIVRVVGLAQDITESSQAKSSLFHLVRLSSEMFFVLNSDGSLFSCNPAMLTALGYSSEALESSDWVSLIHRDDQSLARQKLSQLCSGKPATEIRSRLRRADGSFLSIAWTAAPCDQTGLIHSVARDVTTDDEAEAAAERQNAATQKLSRLSPRELEIVQMVADGKPSKVIAHELDLSRRTVEKHRSNLMRKLNVQSVADVIRLTLQSRE